MVIGLKLYIIQYLYMFSCEATCSINEVGGSASSKRSSDDEPEPLKLRTIYGNASATEPWLDDEVARWHVIEGRANNLVFSCDKIPNVCQNMCFGVVSLFHLACYSFSDIAKLIVWS